MKRTNKIKKLAILMINKNKKMNNKNKKVKKKEMIKLTRREKAEQDDTNKNSEES